MDSQKTTNQDDLMIISKRDVLQVMRTMLSAVVSCIQTDASIPTSIIDSSTITQDDNKLITATEVLDQLKISYPTLWRYGKASMQGTKYYLPARKINGRNMYLASDVKRMYELRFGRNEKA